MKYLWGVFAVLVSFLLVGCNTPSEPVLNVDLSDIDCGTIEQGRTRVNDAYAQAVEDARNDYSKAVIEFDKEMEACLAGLWNGGPCDDQRKKMREAFEIAKGDISNDDAYNTYKAAKSEWDGCYGNRDENYKDWEEKNLNDQQNCKDIHDTMRDAAYDKLQATQQTAEKERDALLAKLEKMEEDCDNQDEEDDTDVAVDSPSIDESEACDDGEYTIPGANGTPRRGSARDLGAQDAALTALITLAEGVTGTPVPTSAINDQIFAGIVCVKLRSRIAEIIMEESDAVASGNRRAEIAARKKLADYRRAMRVWCAIAEGRQPIKLRTEVSQLQNASFGSCDMGETAYANVANTEAIEVIETAEGLFLPSEDLAIVSVAGDRDGDKHYHAKDGVSVTATDGTVLTNFEVCQKNIGEDHVTKLMEVQ